MENQIHFELKPEIVDELKAYSELLGKDINTIMEEALRGYFEAAHKQLMAKDLEGDGGQTNLDFDEFWDGVDI